MSRLEGARLLFVLVCISACSDAKSDNGTSTASLTAEEASQSPLLKRGKRSRFLRTIPLARTMELENRHELAQKSPRPYPYDYSDDPEIVAANEAHKALLEPVGEDEFSVILGDGATGKEYQVTQTLEGLQTADEFARSLGHDGDAGIEGGGAEAEEPAQLQPIRRLQTIIGSDDRKNYGISTSYPSNSWPHRAIARIVTSTGASSGTLIGNRLVLVSAHATINSSGVIDWPDITPRQDTVSPPPPYGTVGAYTYVYPAGWVSLGCSTTSTDWRCDAYDWVVLILWPTPFGSNHPSFLGYASGSDTNVQGWFHYLRGFPSCGGSQSPSPCTWGVMYGHWGDNPVLTEPLSGWPYYGIKARLSHTVDSSEGQSGAAVYSYEPGSGGPYVVSTSVANSAGVPGTGGIGPRISPTMVSYFNSLRASYP